MTLREQCILYMYLVTPLTACLVGTTWVLVQTVSGPMAQPILGGLWSPLTILAPGGLHADPLYEEF